MTKIVKPFKKLFQYSGDENNYLICDVEQYQIQQKEHGESWEHNEKE